MLKDRILTKPSLIFSQSSKESTNAVQAIRDLQNQMIRSSRALNDSQKTFTKMPAFHIAQQLGWLKSNLKFLPGDTLSLGEKGLTLFREDQEPEFFDLSKFIKTKVKAENPDRFSATQSLEQKNEGKTFKGTVAVEYLKSAMQSGLNKNFDSKLPRRNYA